MAGRLNTEAVQEEVETVFIKEESETVFIKEESETVFIKEESETVFIKEEPEIVFIKDELPEENDPLVAYPEVKIEGKIFLKNINKIVNYPYYYALLLLFARIISHKAKIHLKNKVNDQKES